MMRYLLVLVGVFILVGTSFGAAPNDGSNTIGISSGHVLSHPDSRSCNILYCPADDDLVAFRNDLAGLTGGVVDYFDSRMETPSMDLLMEYDYVFTYPNSSYLDNVAMGDLLADFVDAGHNVILGVWCTYTIGNSLAGRIMDVGYSPVYSPDGGNHYELIDYAGDGSTCLYSGVTSFNHTYRDFLALQGAGVQDGSYVDGEIAAAYNEIGVVYVNGFPGEANFDWTTLIKNAACSCEGVIATESVNWSSLKSMYR